MAEAQFAHEGHEHEDAGLAPPGAVPADQGLGDVPQPPAADPVGGGGDREVGPAGPAQPQEAPLADPPPVVGEAWTDPPRGEDAQSATGAGDGGGRPAAGDDAVAGTVQPPQAAPQLGGGRELPFTGAETWVIVACAFMLLASGAIFRLSARREARAAKASAATAGVDVQFAWRGDHRARF